MDLLDKRKCVCAVGRCNLLADGRCVRDYRDGDPVTVVTEIAHKIVKDFRYECTYGRQAGASGIIKHVTRNRDDSTVVSVLILQFGRVEPQRYYESELFDRGWIRQESLK